MAEFYYDTRDGSLLVGAAAIEPRVEEAGPAIVSLRDLLMDKEFPYTTHDYVKISGEQWSHDELAQLGTWALRVMQQDGEEAPVLARRHYERLYVLGLGPYMRRQKAIKTMRELRAAAGSPEGHDPGLYDEWTAADFVKYAAGLSQRLGRRPRKEDYTAADGPSARIIHKRFGGVGELNEMIGYPNVRAWEPEDFVSWGVQVMRANPHRNFNYFLLEDLSRIDRGPSESPIYRHFGTFTKFKGLVEYEFARQNSLEEEKRIQLLDSFEKLKHSGEHKIPKDPPEKEKISFIGKFELARQCLNNRTDRDQLAANVAKLPVTELIQKLRKYNDGLDTARIETEAVILDVYNIIWPPDELEELYRVA